MPLRYEAVPNEDGGWKIVALPDGSDRSTDRIEHLPPDVRRVVPYLPNEIARPVQPTTSDSTNRDPG